MSSYILLIVFIIILYVLLRLLKIKNFKSIFINISFITLFLFLALRSENIGTDLKNYKLFFEYNNIFKLKYLITFSEPGYALYSFIIFKLFSGSFRWLLIITAVISLIGPYHFIKKYSNNYLLSIIIYICLNYYIFLFSGLRQSIAISILLLSIDSIFNKRFIRFIIYLIVAIMFHKSSIVFLPAYFLNCFDIRKKHIPILFIIIAVCFVLRFKIMHIFSLFLYDEYSLLNNTNSGFKLLIVYLGFFIFITFFKERVILENEKNKLFYNFFFIGMIIQIFASVEANAYRAALYYIISLVILLTSVENCFTERSKNMYNILLGIILIAYFIVTISNSSLVSGYSML